MEGGVEVEEDVESEEAEFFLWSWETETVKNECGVEVPCVSLLSEDDDEDEEEKEEREEVLGHGYGIEVPCISLCSEDEEEVVVEEVEQKQEEGEEDHKISAGSLDWDIPYYLDPDSDSAYDADDESGSPGSAGSPPPTGSGLAEICFGARGSCRSGTGSSVDNGRRPE